MKDFIPNENSDSDSPNNSQNFPQIFENYLKNIESGELKGDSICLLAISEALGIPFTVICGDVGLTYVMDFQPKVNKFFFY